MPAKKKNPFNFRAQIALVDSLNLRIILGRLIKKEIDFKERYHYMKNSAGNQTISHNVDFLEIRAASILLFSLEKPQSVNKLRLKYTRTKNRGNRPDRNFRASGSIIRYIVQELQKKGLLEQHLRGRYCTTRAKELIRTSIIEAIKTTEKLKVKLY